MERFFFTYVGIFIFMMTFLLMQHHANAQVSPRMLLENYREMFAVKQGHSLDPGMSIMLRHNVNNVPNNMKVSNHVRNLRVFISVDNAGMPVLYLEQSKPHSFYVIRGPFDSSFNKKVFKWTDPTTLSFSATGTDDTYRMFSINVHTLSWTSSQLEAKDALQNSPDGATDL